MTLGPVSSQATPVTLKMPAPMRMPRRAAYDSTTPRSRRRLWDMGAETVALFASPESWVLSPEWGELLRTRLSALSSQLSGLRTQGSISEPRTAAVRSATHEQRRFARRLDPRAHRARGCRRPRLWPALRRRQRLPWPARRAHRLHLHPDRR